VPVLTSRIVGAGGSGGSVETYCKALLYPLTLGYAVPSPDRPNGQSGVSRPQDEGSIPVTEI
jgi:hypothetical protein